MKLITNMFTWFTLSHNLPFLKSGSLLPYILLCNNTSITWFENFSRFGERLKIQKFVFQQLEANASITEGAR